jgi:pimeloyl-ACP methyl ester carboxylesterase
MGPGMTVDAIRPTAERLRDTIRNATTPMDTPPNMSNTPAGVARVTAWTRAANRKVVAEALYEDLTSDLRPDVARLTRPITMLYPVPNPAAEAMVGKMYGDAYAAAPHVKMVPIQNSYHFIMLDQPAAFRAAVDAFIAGK